MYQGKLRIIILVLMALYTILTLYFLFLGFDRASLNQGQGIRFNLIPERIPLNFPMERSFQIWFFELGNFAAFIPFGIVIPLLFRCNFFRFIGLFVLCITVLETLQMISRLGAFDINDIIINTLGAAVGYGSQRIVTRNRVNFKGFLTIVLLAIVLSLGTITVVGGINHYLNNGSGERVALNELALQDGSVLWDESLPGFTAGLTKIDPQINFYSRENTRTNEFTYVLDSKYANLAGYVAIPSDALSSASSGRSEIAFIADGTEIYSIQYNLLGMPSNSRENQFDSFQIPLQGINELTIKISNDDPNPDTNVVLWDITLTEVNTGQRILNSIRSLF